MTHLILLLGPSGIGKTTLVKQFLSKVKSVHCVTLDNIAHLKARQLKLIDTKDDLNALIKVLEYDRNRFLQFGLDALEEHCLKVNSNDNKSWIVDVGTGFLDAESSLNWIHQYPSICIMSESTNAFDRFRKSRGLDISYEQYMATQFSKTRLNIYNKASVVIKTDGLDIHASANRFACSVIGMLTPICAFKALNEWFS